MSPSAARNFVSMASSTASSGWRKSTLKNTSPGMTLRLFGRFSMRPTVPTASGMLAGDGVDAVDEARGAQKRVFAQPHGRGAGVGVLAGDGDLVPAHALHALDDADHAVFGSEDRALLDVQLEQGGELVRAGFLFAAIADAPELVAEGFAVAVGAGVGVVGGEHAGEHAGGEHGRGEARAFLVGPVDD